jgi:hypothetical protein
LRYLRRLRGLFGIRCRLAVDLPTCRLPRRLLCGRVRGAWRWRQRWHGARLALCGRIAEI